MSNRPQRRKLAKQSLSPKEMTHVLKQEQYTGIKQAVEAMFVVVAYELHRRNWKKSTILGFIKMLDYTFDSVLQNYIKLEEIRKILKEELDLTI